jgi:hypothetical protein
VRVFTVIKSIIAGDEKEEQYGDIENYFMLFHQICDAMLLKSFFEGGDQQTRDLLGNVELHCTVQSKIMQLASMQQCLSKIKEKLHLLEEELLERGKEKSTSQARVFITLEARKNPGYRWSRDSQKIDCLRGEGKVSYYMLPLPHFTLRSQGVSVLYRSINFENRIFVKIVAKFDFCFLLNYKKYAKQIFIATSSV